MKKNVIEKGILAKKIKEHFTKNPKATSVIIKNNSDNANKFWRVQREGKNFKIVEVSTAKNEFMLEMNMPMREDASPAQQQAVIKMSQALASAAQTPQGQKDLSYKFNELSPSLEMSARQAFQDILKSMGITTDAQNSADSGQFGQLGGIAKTANASIASKQQLTTR